MKEPWFAGAGAVVGADILFMECGEGILGIPFIATDITADMGSRPFAGEILVGAELCNLYFMRTGSRLEKVVADVTVLRIPNPCGRRFMGH